MGLIGLVVVEENCTGCGVCETTCPFGAIQVIDGVAKVLDNCTLCGTCVDACPFEALIMKSGEKKEIADKTAYKGIMTYAEVDEGQLSHVALEMLSVGRDLADKRGTSLSALLIGGEGVKEHAEKLIKHGADRVFVIEHKELSHFNDELYAEAAVKLINDKKPEIFIGGATAQGRALLPRISATIKTGLTADCTELTIDPETGNLMQTRPAFGGNIMATILTPDNRPQIATIRPRVMKVSSEDPDRKGEVEIFPYSPDASRILKVIKKAIVMEEDKVNLQDAEIIVSGGRGVGGKEGFSVIYSLAKELGAAVGASRAAVDAGWIPYAHQVGQTGTTVSPKLYIAAGISGAIQHQVGMRSSDVIIAINTDPDAPIFDIATYGFVADLHKIIPSLLAEIKKLKS